MVDIIRSLLATNAARLIAGASAATTAGALWIAGQLGVELTAEVIAGVAAVAGFVATELIRRFVWSEKTVAETVAAAIESETAP